MTMEKMTIKAAISYIDDVIKSNKKNDEENTIIIPNIFINNKDIAEKYKQVKAWLKELEEYRKLEKDGLLLRLPCKVGYTVYKINSAYTKCSYYNTTFDEFHCEGCELGFDEECDSKITYSISDIKIKSLYSIFDYWNCFGKTVFLTCEEAENKLKELNYEA